MLRAMVFIDHMNFDNSLKNYYREILKQPQEILIDYKTFPQRLVEKVAPDCKLIKTYLFAPKPDDFLRTDTYWDKYYTWISNFKNFKNFDVIEGEYKARQVEGAAAMDINKKNTYYKVEKGTDINMAVNIITKAFHNSYDTAILITGDRDYAMVLEQLKIIGKLSVISAVKGQNISSIKQYADGSFIMDDTFFKTCARKH